MCCTRRLWYRTHRETRGLHDWYGIDHEPQLPPDAQPVIDSLEQAQAGSTFERLFLRTFSHHHYDALTPTTQCLTGRDLRHQALHRYCEGILTGQIGDIDMMRTLLCKHFKVCDLQPFQHPAGTSNEDKSGSP